MRDVALFSYRVRFDHGSAPNPYWCVCTLVICKPRIRRRARSGDWVIGTGAANTPTGDLSGSLVYAMQVARALDMRDYDAWSARHPRKRPDPSHPDRRRAVGDSIYDFASDPPAVRPGVHTEAHRAHDLSGRRALLSRRFVYFGRAAVQLPPYLLEIVKDGPGLRGPGGGTPRNARGPPPHDEDRRRPAWVRLRAVIEARDAKPKSDDLHDVRSKPAAPRPVRGVFVFRVLLRETGQQPFFAHSCLFRHVAAGVTRSCHAVGDTSQRGCTDWSRQFESTGKPECREELRGKSARSLLLP
jgi:hypothetical protein